jgi:hypothetical protein
MDIRIKCIVGGAAAGLLLVSTAIACGDKLVALGGGVPFDRIHERRAGNVILYLNPQTRLNTANADIRLDAALTRAGHSVRTVATRRDLELALGEAEADVVLMDWADAAQLKAGISDRVPTLPVLYGGTPGELAHAEAGEQCVLEADRRRASQLLKAVDRIIEDHAKGRQLDCGRIGGRGVS